MDDINENILMEVPKGTDVNDMISFPIICRLCAGVNQNSRYIGIYSADGIGNDLAMKINLYLPIKVYETDDLPQQCCWQCVSTILAWHNFVITSIEVDRRLKDSDFIPAKDNEEPSNNYQPHNE